MNSMPVRIPRSRWFYVACVALLGAGLASWWHWRRPRDFSPHETYARATAAGRNALADPSADPALAVLQLRDWARAAVTDIKENIRDYSAVLLKRERSGGELSPVQMMFIKVRQQPFSVYMHFLAPPDRKGDEAIFVDGQNGGNILGHTTGLLNAVVGTVSLPPEGMIAMKGQLHPITQLGLLFLTQRLLDHAEEQVREPTCRIRFRPQAKINDIPCLCIEAAIPHPSAGHPQGTQMIRVFIDKQRKLPLRYEQYDWTGQPADKPLLMEQYTYVDLKLNNGFTGADFDKRSPSYSFP